MLGSSSPVLQLARMPGSASKSRAAKKRTDLINAFDELSSHLHTTFSALSSALAKNSARQASEASGAPVPRANAYLSFVLGPAVGAPRARIMFVVEGLEVRVWGAREEDIGASVTGPVNRAEEEGGSDDVIEGEEDEEDESQEDSEDSDAEDSDEEYFSGESGPSEDEPEEDRPSSEPPSSRSPSPDPPSSAPRHSPPPIGENLPQQPHATPPKGHSGPQLSPERQRSHAEEQQALRAAERLLSRTLLNAYADGGGMAAELCTLLFFFCLSNAQLPFHVAPTQTQVLLRAPRRFSHPAWQPRQNLSVALDPVLASFLDKSGLRASAKAEEANTRRGRKGGVRTEGVVIRCRDADGESEDHADPPLGDESDEMIWWVWTGKLTGFSDW